MSVVLDGLTLPEDLVWTNEFTESKIAQNRQRSLTGSLIVRESVKLKGIPMQLSGSQDSGWIERSVLIQLQAIVDTVDHDMILAFNGVNYNVRFDRDSKPIEAGQIIDCSNPQATDPYTLIINLITV